MKKQRHIKVLTIVALIVAVLGMTLGFAAFSTTLSISSSATVIPNSEDFKMVIYGMKDAKSADEFNLYWQLNENYLDKNISYPINYNSKTGTVASINNETMSISNINATFTSAWDDRIYYFIIKNEGKFDAYLNYDNISTENESVAELYGVCTPEEGTTPKLVEDVCKSTPLVVLVTDDEGNQYIEESHKALIPKGEYIILYIQISYNPYTLADGPFSINFPDVQLNFSTQP